MASAKKVWELKGNHCLFHYATAEAVTQIAEQGLYVVSNRKHQSHGAGLFLTTIRPGEKSRDEICDQLFLHQRDHDTFSGVLVLNRSPLLPVKPAGTRACVHLAPAGTVIDLSPVLVGYGIYQGSSDDEWLFTSSCYERS